MEIFTRKDIQTDIFEVDGYLGNYSKYLIRFVAPKHEVKVDRKTWDRVRSEWWSFGAKTEKVFDRLDEAEDYRKKTETEGTLVEIIHHSPLDLPL